MNSMISVKTESTQEQWTRALVITAIFYPIKNTLKYNQRIWIDALNRPTKYNSADMAKVTLYFTLQSTP